MFNAIFGNFLFSKQVDSVEETQQQEQLTKQSAEASTQTIGKSTTVVLNSLSSAGPKLKRSYSAVVQANLPTASESTTKSTDLEWVLVDPSDEADKCGSQSQQMHDKGVDSCDMINERLDESMTVPMEQDATLNKLDENEFEDENIVDDNKNNNNEDDDGDIMLRSFFERNENEAVSTTTTTNAVVENNWLITPLPCLASITSTQRSVLIENDPMENLLIEQPSVFMNVTGSPQKQSQPQPEPEKPQPPKQQPQKPKKQLSFLKTVENKPEPIVAGPEPVPIEKLITRSTRKSYSSVVAGIVSPAKPAAPVVTDSVIVKTVAEKRKESEVSSSPVAESEDAPVRAESVESLASTETAVARTASPIQQLRNKKESKKQKKNGPSSPVTARISSQNKENQQLRNLLLNDMKKSPNARLMDAINAGNKKQMKRNNKNVTMSGSANIKQRKFHNLQQPVFAAYNNSQY